MKNIFTIFAISLFLFSCAIHQKGENGKPGEDGKIVEQAKSVNGFNQKLADSLGADKYGMKGYFLVILKTGSKDKEITDKTQRSELFKGHFSNMTEMEKSGKLKLAGPFSTKNNLGYRGIFILDVKTDEEAKNLIELDPTVKAGVFDYEILPWYGSAALPLYLKYHDQVAKENP